MSLLQTSARKAADMLGRESWIVGRLRPAYESLLDHISGDQGISWMINGVSYQIDPHHRHRLAHNYDAPVAAFLRERVQPGSICLDVGANVGVYVLQFAHWSAPGGQVIAFEPNPGARAVLERHIQLNGLGERVQVAPVAVGEFDGEATLYAADADGMSRLNAPNDLIADRVTALSVSVVTLDVFCAGEQIRPDWLFIDIEGFEIAALAGASELIKSRGSQIGVIVEMHPSVWPSANTTRARAEAVFADIGRRAVPLTGQNDPLNDYGLVYLECV